MDIKLRIAAREVLVAVAADLLLDDAGLANEEYLRGQVELIADATRGAGYNETPSDDPDNAKYNVEQDIREAVSQML